ncbi:signal peptide peptidase SppA [Rhizobiaceae bacterium n13]|uniref:Signal peptide peptidase SppA n=1 Tax=Ferirhizobium litorale TaxID=2927786 RepID=A0AAE3QFS7_9HYPH|nr:signal peptide peptidase SppA [Fererhizobium litorale]MDI7864742.1 signal peptide peptidase SppA [Fererhizobium litorale]MDI7924977.1 signal peptide peptidase SppA [Fererhizobium litorale]
MDQSVIVDRGRLRRKLSFWRVLAALLIVGLGFALYSATAGDFASRALRPHIARVTVSGLIQDDTELQERLEKIAENDQVKALIVSISSPGGTTYGGERLYYSIREVAEKKPVVSSIRTLAASAGYMIATAGDTIIAGETSITGSIGVLFQYPQVRELMDKLGISLQSIKSSPLKAEPSPFTDASEEAKAMIRAMVMDSYDWFVDLVAERRNMPRSEALRLADGSIYTGRQALKAKLVDRLGDEPEIRAYLEEKGVTADLPIIDWEAPRSSSLLFFSDALSRLINLVGYGDFIRAEDLRNLTGEKLFLDGLISVWQVGRD